MDSKRNQPEKNLFKKSDDLDLSMDEPNNRYKKYNLFEAEDDSPFGKVSYFLVLGLNFLNILFISRNNRWTAQTQKSKDSYIVNKKYYWN